MRLSLGARKKASSLHPPGTQRSVWVSSDSQAVGRPVNGSRVAVMANSRNKGKKDIAGSYYYSVPAHQGRKPFQRENGSNGSSISGCGSTTATDLEKRGYWLGV